MKLHVHVNDLSNAPFHVAEIFDCIDDSYWVIQELMFDLINECSPLRKWIIKRHHVPFMNWELRMTIEMYGFNMFWRKWYRCLDELNLERFWKHRNSVTHFSTRSVDKAYQITRREGYVTQHKRGKISGIQLSFIFHTNRNGQTI